MSSGLSASRPEGDERHGPPQYKLGLVTPERAEAGASPTSGPSVVADAVAVGAELLLDIGAPGHGGFCIARHEGRAVFVRHALPGEHVRARVTEVRSSYVRADAIEILTGSPDRVVPPCPYAGPGKCGGCDWQHATLPAQREIKSAVIAEQFRRLARLDVNPAVEPAPGTPDGLGWRTRVGFAVDRSGRAGLRKHRSHDLYPIDTCLIAHPRITELGIPQVRWPGAAVVEATASGTGDRAIVVEAKRGSRVSPQHADPAVAVGRRAGRAVAMGRGTSTVTERAAGRDWQISLTSFWQIHPAAADTLVEAVARFADVRPGDTIVDLYAGAGLFAGALLDAATGTARVVAVESSASAVDDARRNLGASVDVRGTAVEPGVVAALAAELEQIDVVVLDPPRTGAGAGVVADIAAAAPRAVVYVACDPAALARDVATFMSLGYTMRELGAFDLFLMTSHVECIALLTAT